MLTRYPANTKPDPRLDRPPKLFYTSLHLSCARPFRVRPAMKSSSDPSATPSIQSPCVRNCCLDDADICLGCGRRLEEILHWGEASNSEKEAILALAKERREQR
jgi:uncharacterized protein